MNSDINFTGGNFKNNDWTKPLPCKRRHVISLAILTAFVTMIGVMPSAGQLQIVNLISGDNAGIGNPDPSTTFLGGSQESPLSTSAFTPANFLSAQTGAHAWVVYPYSTAWVNPATTAPLAGSGAQWISTVYSGSGGGGGNAPTALYAQTFTLGPSPWGATLNFSWAADDLLGDSQNPAGVYINGNPITAITGGGFTSVSTVTGIFIPPTDLNNGVNTLYVYDRDAQGVVAGVVYDGMLTVIPEPSSLALAGMGLAALAAVVRTRSSRWVK